RLVARGFSPDDVRRLDAAHFEIAMLDASERDVLRALMAFRRGDRFVDVRDSGLARCLTDVAATGSTSKLANSFTLDLCDAERVRSPCDGDADALLAAYARKGIATLGARYAARLERELEVIRAAGLASYLLVAREIAELARARGIVIANRGSAASSLVCFAIGVTTIDPVVNDLVLERFVHAQRLEPADVDFDVASDRRDELIEAIVARWGAERVAMVSSVQTFGDASAEKAVARMMRGAHRSDLVRALVGKPMHTSVHPGAVIVADRAIAERVSLEGSTRGVAITQFDAASLAHFGLSKIDVLGNRALAALASCPSVTPDARAVTAMLRDARTIGCFQIETPPMRSLLRNVGVESVQDLAVVLALVRPGPGAWETKRAVIAGDDENVLLFEEDVIREIARCTHLPLDAADAIRAAIVEAGDDAAELERVRHAFFERAPSHADATDTWDRVARFAAYAFNRAHALGYAEIAWQSAATKLASPVEYARATLATYGGAYPLRTICAAFRREGVRIIAPDVNRSARAHVVDGSGGVLLGLDSIKHLTHKTKHRIVSRRPFASITDFFRHVSPSARELRSLVMCGACDALSPLTPNAYPIAHEDLLVALDGTNATDVLDSFVVRAPSGPNASSFRALVRIRNELEILAMHPSGHPMRVLRDEVKRVEGVPIRALRERIGRARVAGIVAASRRIETARGGAMHFVTLEDETDLIELVVRPHAYAELGDPITTPGPFLIDGTVQRDHGDVMLVVERALPFHRR
ncbi:MAG TPA: hypothetical protein VH054_28250, partial [Polyangiaceae bacterium]|nr:hypothetical protein [Polyangiaceae bacterium]